MTEAPARIQLGMPHSESTETEPAFEQDLQVIHMHIRVREALICDFLSGCGKMKEEYKEIWNEH